jgi:hypothetical protein
VEASGGNTSFSEGPPLPSRYRFGLTTLAADMGDGGVLVSQKMHYSDEGKKAVDIAAYLRMIGATIAKLRSGAEDLLRKHAGGEEDFEQGIQYFYEQSGDKDLVERSIERWIQDYNRLAADAPGNPDAEFWKMAEASGIKFVPTQQAIHDEQVVQIAKAQY